MNVRYVVELTEEELAELHRLIQGGQHKSRKLKRAQLLLAAHEGYTDESISGALHVGTATVFRTRRNFVEGGLERALNETPRNGAARKLTGKEEASVGRNGLF